MIVAWVLLKIINEQHSRVLEILKNSNTCSRVLEKVFELKTYYLKKSKFFDEQSAQETL